MGVVETFIKRLEEMKASINVSIKESIETNKNILIDQQTEQQMNKGKDANSISFTPLNRLFPANRKFAVWI